MKKIISSLLASAIILAVLTSCMSELSNEVISSGESSQKKQITSSDEVTTSAESSKEKLITSSAESSELNESSQEYGEKIENAVAEFIKKPEVIDIVASKEDGMGPPEINIVDMTGDNIPEILFTRLYIDGMMNIHTTPNEITYVYDINTLEKIGSFRGGGFLLSDLKKIQTESGEKFVVFFNQYKGSGRTDTLVSEITVLANEIVIEHKFAFICQREEYFRYTNRIFKDLTVEEGLAIFKHWSAPNVNDFENWAGGSIKSYTEYLCNLEFIDYQLSWSAECSLDANGVVQLEEKKDAKPKDN